jgi:hypothetical protein
MYANVCEEGMCFGWKIPANQLGTSKNVCVMGKYVLWWVYVIRISTVLDWRYSLFFPELLSKSFRLGSRPTSWQSDLCPAPHLVDSTNVSDLVYGRLLGTISDYLLVKATSGAWAVPERRPELWNLHILHRNAGVIVTTYRLHLNIAVSVTCCGTILRLHICAIEYVFLASTHCAKVWFSILSLLT